MFLSSTSPVFQFFKWQIFAKNVKIEKKFKIENFVLMHHYESVDKNVDDITRSISAIVTPLYRQMICLELLAQNLYSKSP